MLQGVCNSKPSVFVHLYMDDADGDDDNDDDNDDGDDDDGDDDGDDDDGDDCIYIYASAATLRCVFPIQLCNHARGWMLHCLYMA